MNLVLLQVYHAFAEPTAICLQLGRYWSDRHPPGGRHDRHPCRYATDKVLVLHCHLVTALNGCNKSNIVGSFILSTVNEKLKRVLADYLFRCPRSPHGRTNVIYLISPVSVVCDVRELWLLKFTLIENNYTTNYSGVMTRRNHKPNKAIVDYMMPALYTPSSPPSDRRCGVSSTCRRRTEPRT